ncbi:hypothetical protein [Pectinatus haikarae]|uniref:Uncharacterized protein n=1 Tax=Pectinatus haikarae TaxID=349096 RepID=A0ABT9Y9T3_9FIRM|nr:hypothetical protein [Pectinatus haikarae]MDQ0204255.1 hypothetical protein [Pectinatus haikarae]
MNTLIIIAAIVFWVVSSMGKKKKTTSSKRRLPPIKNPQSEKNSSAGKITLDHMMKHPHTAAPPAPAERQNSSPAPAAAKEIEVPPLFSSTMLQRNSTSIPLRQVLPPMQDNSTSITSAQMDIDSKTILRAITYAEVLNPPKSVKYLRQYGIKRFPLK